MGPFVAIAAAILTFLAFWVQFKANEQQRKDIALERFESNLFQLIQIQEDITNNLQFLAYANSNFLNKVKISGRQIFKALYEEKYTPLCGIKDDIKERGIISYEEDKDIGILDHYFRHLYRVFKFIDEAPIFTNDKNKKYDYYINTKG